MTNTQPKYFFESESGYEKWLEQNQNVGFVASGFTNKEGSKVWEGKLTIHKLPCDSSLNHNRFKGSRTNYGKLCHLDEKILIAECRQRMKGEYKLGRCHNCYKPRTLSI